MDDAAPLREYRVVYENGNCTSGFTDRDEAVSWADGYRNARVEWRTTWQPLAHSARCDCLICDPDPGAPDASGRDHWPRTVRAATRPTETGQMSVYKDLDPHRHRPAGRAWSDRLARRVKPANVDGNMSVRANLWRALVDWSWGIELETPYLRRALWVYRRLMLLKRLGATTGRELYEPLHDPLKRDK